eukprot:sb/3471675/
MLHFSMTMSFAHLNDTRDICVVLRYLVHPSPNYPIPRISTRIILRRSSIAPDKSINYISIIHLWTDPPVMSNPSAAEVSQLHETTSQQNIGSYPQSYFLRNPLIPRRKVEDSDESPGRLCAPLKILHPSCDRTTTWSSQLFSSQYLVKLSRYWSSHRCCMWSPLEDLASDTSNRESTVCI